MRREPSKRSRSRFTGLGRFSLLSLVIILVGGCTNGKRKIDATAEDQRAELPENLPDVFARLPADLPVPSGVSPEIWNDIGWLPNSVEGITVFSSGSILSFVEWLRRSFAADLPDCSDVLDSIDRYYMVEDQAYALGESTSQVLIFHGQIDRDRVEACAERAAELLGATVARSGAMTSIGTDNPHYLGWARRGEDTIVLYADSRERIDALVADGPLLDASSVMVELLRRSDFDGGTWTVGSKDFGTVLLGVPSTGHMTVVEQTHSVRPNQPQTEIRTRVIGKLLFASPTQALAAADEAAELQREAAEIGLDASGTATANEDTLEFDVTYVVNSDAGAEAMQPLLDLIERRRGGAPVDSL
ncbi:MAG: hypothetical protein R6X02_32730 [Enhygromyxa sp.]